MPGNEQYPGAKRRPGSKKSATKGSGGKRRRGLEGKGPTPRAENRVGHPKARAKARAEARAAQPTRAKQLEKARRPRWWTPVTASAPTRWPRPWTGPWRTRARARSTPPWSPPSSGRSSAPARTGPPPVS